MIRSGRPWARYDENEGTLSYHRPVVRIPGEAGNQHIAAALQCSLACEDDQTGAVAVVLRDGASGAGDIKLAYVLNSQGAGDRDGLELDLLDMGNGTEEFLIPASEGNDLTWEVLQGNPDLPDTGTHNYIICNAQGVTRPEFTSDPDRWVTADVGSEATIEREAVEGYRQYVRALLISFKHAAAGRAVTLGIQIVDSDTQDVGILWGLFTNPNAWARTHLLIVFPVPIFGSLGQPMLIRSDSAETGGLVAITAWGGKRP